MSKGLEALDRITGTQNLTMYEQNECLKTIEKELTEHEEIKTYMQQYGIQNIEELRRIIHNNWVICQKFKTDTANVAKALEIIKEKRVDADYFIYTCVVDDWSYEDYLEEYNSTSSWFICGQRSFGYQGEKQPLLTREEYDLLKEVLLWVKV